MDADLLSYPVYVVCGLIAAVLVPAILPRTTGRTAAWRRIGAWLVVSGLVIGVVSVARVVAANLGAVAALSPGPTDEGYGPVVARGLQLGTAAAFLLGWSLFAYVLAFLLHRRVQWSTLEARTGWNLAGWRRLVPFVLAGPLMAWPLSWAGAVAGLLSTALAFEQIHTIMPEVRWTDYLPTVAWPLGVLAAVAVAWPLRKPTQHDRHALTDGSAPARWLAWIGAVGVLAVGLTTVVGVLAEAIAGALARDPMATAAAGGSISWAEWSTVVVALAALALLRRPEWTALERLTGRSWSTAARSLGALTLGTWVAWPLAAFDALLRRDWGVIAAPDALMWASVPLAAIAVALLLRAGRPAGGPGGT